MFYKCPMCWCMVKHYKGSHVCHTRVCHVCKMRYSTRDHQHICYMQPIIEKVKEQPKPQEPEGRDILGELLEKGMS